MPRSNGSISPEQGGGLLDEASLKSFRAELICLLKLAAPFRQRLERLAAQTKPDPGEALRTYRALPVEAAHALSFIVSLDADDFSRLRKQLGEHAKDVDDIRARFDALAPPFNQLDDLFQGIVNSWESVVRNASYSFSRESPSLEFWLFDSVGNQIFYSRSDVDDFAWLAEAVLEDVADSVKQAKQRGLPISKLCTKNVLSAVASIEQHCQRIKASLSRK
jgi:hypothetical protein